MGTDHHEHIPGENSLLIVMWVFISLTVIGAFHFLSQMPAAQVAEPPAAESQLEETVPSLDTEESASEPISTEEQAP